MLLVSVPVPALVARRCAPPVRIDAQAREVRTASAMVLAAAAEHGAGTEIEL